MTIQNRKRDIIDIGKFLYDKGYIVATDGNISARLNSKEIFITRSGVCKGEMALKDILPLSLREAKQRGNLKVSSEHRMHSAIYANRPDINAVIHAHPLYSTIFTVTEKKLNVKLLTETEETLGQIGYVGYYKPGSPELAKAVGKTSIKFNAIILTHHGVVVCGKDLSEARYRLERLEFLAKIMFYSSLSSYSIFP